MIMYIGGIDKLNDCLWGFYTQSKFSKKWKSRGKIPFFVIDPLFTSYSTIQFVLIGSWQGSFVRNVAFHSQYFELKGGLHFLQFFMKIFSENLSQIQGIENIQNFLWLSHKNMPISETEGYSKNPFYCFLEKHKVFLLVLK